MKKFLGEPEYAEIEYKEIRITNGDRIRAMSDEELAAVIMCPCDNQTGLCSEVGCIACCLDWLKQPAEVE